MMTCCWMYVVIQFRKPTGLPLQNNPLDYETLHDIETPMHSFGGKPQQTSGLRKKNKKYVEHGNLGDGDDDAEAEEHAISIEEIKDQHAAAAELERSQSQKQDDSKVVKDTSSTNPYAKHKISTKTFLKKSLFNKEAIHDQVVKMDKKGNILHNAIHAVRKEDLEDLNIPIPAGWNTTTMEDALKGRGPLVDILHDAGVQELDVVAILSLPKWDVVTKLYGDSGPVIVGLDTCHRFQDTIPQDQASIGIAGLFNTGTNPMNMYLEENCIMPHIKHERHGGMRFQVPWGKHVPASWKWNVSTSFRCVCLGC